MLPFGSGESAGFRPDFPSRMNAVQGRMPFQIDTAQMDAASDK